MTAVWASHHEALCSDGVVAPHVRAPTGAPYRWGYLMANTLWSQPWTPAAGPPWGVHCSTHSCATRCSI
jgi:hypothetical protein